MYSNKWDRKMYPIFILKRKGAFDSCNILNDLLMENSIEKSKKCIS